jgi:cytochrome c oxidase subunit 1
VAGERPKAMSAGDLTVDGPFIGIDPRDDARDEVEDRGRLGASLAEWLTTTDHKRIGILYIIAAFGFFFLAGLMAMAIRAELAAPGLQFVDQATYDELFTIHGTLMLLLFGTPVALGLANYFTPLQIGAADMAFPRLNALSFWMFLFGGLLIPLGFFTIGGAAASGWTGYVPLSGGTYSPSAGQDLWIVGLIITGIASIIGSLNFIVTIYTRRAPGMRMFRMPIFTWNILVTAALIVLAFPPFTAALAMLFIDRHLGGSFFDPASGGDAILWQHLFWFFGHPEVYILILPFFGVVTEIIPVFSRKPLFGYLAFVLATVAIAGLSISVWAHHMFTTGAVSLPFFSLASFAIAIPTGIKFFNWIATMWGGELRFPTPMLWTMGFLYLFVVGGITGVMLASAPVDFDLQDTYFVVAHLHNVLIGGTLFALFAGIYFWFPKMTGRFLSERLGQLHFVIWVVGFTLTFLPQYQLGLDGMPRRIADYAPDRGWQLLNDLSTAGSMLLAVGVIPFLLAVVVALRRPADAPPDPWEANSLEWATSSPPPVHNFRSLPPIRSERPVYDAREASTGGRSPSSLAADSSRPTKLSLPPGRFGEEVAFFLRSFVFAAAIGLAYWFLTYEIAGSILLGAFAVATGLLVAYLVRARRRPSADRLRDESVAASDDVAQTEGPFGDDAGHLPGPSAAPIIIGLAVGMIGLGVVFTPALSIVGVGLAIAGGWRWLRSIMVDAAQTNG